MQEFPWPESRPNRRLCPRCNGTGEVTYNTTTFDVIVFEPGVILHEKYIDGTGGTPNRFRWSVKCDHCWNGMEIPIPLSDVIGHNKTGIKLMYDPRDPAWDFYKGPKPWEM